MSTGARTATVLIDTSCCMEDAARLLEERVAARFRRGDVLLKPLQRARRKFKPELPFKAWTMSLPYPPQADPLRRAVRLQRQRGDRTK